MGVKGHLKDLNLMDILQILHAEGKTSCVHLASDRGYGRVYMKNGVISHASHRDEKGEAALTELLSWREGDFDVITGDESAEVTIGADFDSLIKGASQKGHVTPAGPVYEADVESMGLVNRLVEAGILEKSG
jgi:hypothetical protein